ncbi:HAAS signaling domain-containing protein [Nocardia fluminea]|uniref:HAAS signaling domain-containing protein n=1 Tax=Nocardia fluminea TaxID=134984 RepID=UPI003D09F1FA
MADTQSDSDLIDRYVYAVLVHIPRPRRGKVGAELRTRIGEEALNRPVRAVLSQLGPPEDRARRFRGAPRQLIGPRLYDTYLRVLWPAVRAMTIVVGGVSLLTASLAAGAEPTVSGVLLDGMTSAFAGAVYSAFWVTVVFAVIERVAPGVVLHEWRPEDLAPVPHGREIPLGDAIGDLVFAIAVLGVALCFFPALAPPFLAEIAQGLDSGVVSRLLPAVVVVAVLWIAVAGAQLIVRAWTLPITALSIAADLLAIATAAAVLAHRPYFSDVFLTELRGEGGDVGKALDTGIGIGAVAVILVCATAIVTAARKYLGHRQGPDADR